MSKLAKKMRGSPVRTGQYMGPQPVDMYGTPIARPGGPCHAPPPAQPQSWGAACPTGACTSEDLAANLGRVNAGERYGCRELPYWLSGVADANGDLVLSQNSTVTICPTRVMVIAEGGEAGNAVPDDAEMTVFEMGNQNQIAGDPLPLAILGLDGYQTIPFVTDCLKAGLPFRIVLTGLTPTVTYYVGLIGPAIG